MMRSRSIARLMLALMLAFPILARPIPVLAADPSEMLSDPAAEARAERIGKGLRCLVCQSESIEESNADLARDLRTIVRERVKAGDTDRQIRDYVVARYGDYVLLEPPFKASTVVLWVGPFILLALALGIAATVFRRRQAQSTAAGGGDVPGGEQALTADEKRRLDRLLGDRS